jgi:hypothetical protein
MSRDGFVDVFGAVEPGDLASAVAIEAHGRAHSALIVAMDALEDAGNGLNQKQRIELTSVMSDVLDGLNGWAEDYLRMRFDSIRIRELDDERGEPDAG